jgi:hypothetical protein
MQFSKQIEDEEQEFLFFQYNYQTLCLIEYNMEQK